MNVRRIASLLVGVVGVTGVTLGLAPPALAQAGEALQLVSAIRVAASDADIDAALAEIGEPVPGQEAAALLAAVAGRDIQTSSGLPVIASEVAGWRLHSGATLVSARVEDGPIGLSSLTLVIGPTGMLERIVEVAARPLEGGGLSVSQWLDGELMSAETIRAGGTDLRGSVLVRSEVTEYGSGAPVTARTVASFGRSAASTGSGVALDTNPPRGLVNERVGSQTTAKWHPFSWSRFNRCLSSAGVSWAIVAMVGAVCALAGVATAGAAFIACAAGTAGVGSGTIGYCVGYATYW